MELAFAASSLLAGLFFVLFLLERKKRVLASHDQEIIRFRKILQKMGNGTIEVRVIDPGSVFEWSPK